jgi:hypothetical protein
MRTLLTKALIALAITSVAALGADNTLGTWKLNVANSKYTGAPMPVKSVTVTIEASDGGVKQTTTGEQADGSDQRQLHGKIRRQGCAGHRQCTV